MNGLAIRRVTGNVLLPAALAVIGTAGIAPIAKANGPGYHTRTHRTKKISHLSRQELEKRIRAQIKRAVKIVSYWDDGFKLSQPGGEGTKVYIGNSKIEFVRIGFKRIAGRADGARISAEDGKLTAQRMMNIYDEGVALYDTGNALNAGALSGASIKKYEDILNRLTKFANNLEYNNSKVETSTSYWAGQAKEAAKSESPDDFWSGLMKVMGVLIKLWDIFEQYIEPWLGGLGLLSPAKSAPESIAISNQSKTSPLSQLQPFSEKVGSLATAKRREGPAPV